MITTRADKLLYLGLNNHLILVFIRFFECSHTFVFFFQFGFNIREFYSIWSFFANIVKIINEM